LNVVTLWGAKVIGAKKKEGEQWHKSQKKQQKVRRSESEEEHLFEVPRGWGGKTLQGKFGNVATGRKRGRWTCGKKRGKSQGFGTGKKLKAEEKKT